MNGAIQFKKPNSKLRNGASGASSNIGTTPNINAIFFHLRFISFVMYLFKFSGTNIEATYKASQTALIIK